MYTPEQQEAMAAFCREWHRRHALGFPATQVALIQIARQLGVVDSEYTLAHWLAPPDDSVALDHPKASDGAPLQLLRRGGGYKYTQATAHRRDGNRRATTWHPTEEAARREWNRICRSAK